MSRRTGKSRPAPSDGDGRGADPPAVERSNVTLVAGAPPMLKLEISLYSWERGDCEIEITVPQGGELSDLLDWALPEQRQGICGNLRNRITEELADVWDILQGPEIQPGA